LYESSVVDALAFFFLLLLRGIVVTQRAIGIS
jgi:hypothetical protein